MDDSGEKDGAILRQVSCPMDELYSGLGTRPTGLTQDEAAAKLKKFGPNLLPEQAKLELYKKVLEQFKNLFNVLLLIAAGLSFISGVTANDMTSYQMGFAILIVVLISVFFSIFQERRAEKAVEAIKDLVPRNAKVMRDGQVNMLSIAKIVPGDVISLEEGDKVPADARLFKCYEFSVDNSTLTGESDPQKRMALDADDMAVRDLYRYANIVFAGTTVASGSGSAVVLRTGANTEFGRIVSMAQNIVEPPSPLQKELDGTAKLNFVVAIGVGILFLLVAYFFLGLELTPSLLFMIGVMVSLVPEGLQVTVTLSLALSSLAMSRRNVIVKRLSSVETLGSCTVICSDKTGTITEGQMTVRLAWLGGKLFRATGEGYEPEGALTLDGKRVSATERADLLKLCQVAALDNTATLVPPLDRKKSRWTAIGDSTDAALLVMAAKSGLQAKQLLLEQPRIGMVPFDSNRKMMSSIHKDTERVVAYVKGAGNEILSRCDSTYWNGQVVTLSEETRLQIRAQMDGFAKEAYRVLALAYRELPGEMEKYTSESVEAGMTFVGLVAIYDPPRHETPEAVHKARSAGIRIVMMTGDHELTAEAIARRVGIISSSNYTVMTGYKLAQLSDEELSKVLEAQELVFARITPEQKLRIVRTLRAKGETVAVTGDGVNDAPALLEADIGVAMGISGTDVARESADMVLLDDNFASIVNGVEEGRAVFDNLKKFIVYVFCHNWAELATFIAFILLGTPLPLAVMQVLAIDLLMEIPPSLSITMEPPEPGIMDRPPRRKGSRLFDKWALARSAYIGFLIGAYALFWCFTFWSRNGWHFGLTIIGDNAVYVTGTTIVMAGIMAGQLGTLFAMRTNVKSAFSIGLSRNKWLAAAVVAEILLLVMLVYVPFLNPVFSTNIIDPFYWFALYSFAPVILLCEEARKFVLRRTLVVPVAVPVPAAAPAEPGAFEFVEPMPAVEFVERARPVVLPVFMRPGEENAILVALTVGKKAGAPLVIARVADAKSPEWMKKKLDLQVHDRAAGEVPYDYEDIVQPTGAKDPAALVQGLRRIFRETGADTLVMPVRRELFAGKRRAAKEYSWLREFSDKKVVLVSADPRPTGSPPHRQFRILIPVLRTFHKEPFELASTLTENAMVPDVDIVAAKVVEIPQITPLYSFYKPESLVSRERELSFLDNLKDLPLLKVLHSKILIVRRTERDLIDFATERNVDLILLGGEWGAIGHGFLNREDRAVASRAGCTVVVTLPSGARDGNEKR
jgi:Ca2+-transporting ATPase